MGYGYMGGYKTYTADEAIEMISNRTGVSYSEEQLQVLRHKGGACILACAGSGKTTTVVHLLGKRILTGEIQSTDKLMCATYSKAGATELEERTNKLLNDLGINAGITVKTFHAMFYQVLRKFNYNNKVIDFATRRRYIGEALKELKIVLDDDKMSRLDTLLGFQINNLLSDDDMEKSWVFNIDEIDIAAYKSIRDGYAKRKSINGYIDFDDMQLIMYYLVVKSRRMDVIGYCQYMWEYYFIDESQDISKVQLEILRVLATDPNKMVFIGDDDQCIYEWRGADPSLLVNICGYYEVEKFILPTNYRCREEILKVAEVGVTYNKMRVPKDMRYFRTGGEVKTVPYGDVNTAIYDISKNILGEIKKGVEGGKRLKDYAVLGRNNSHLGILANMMFREGIAYSYPEDARFTSMPFYRECRGVLNIVENGGNRQDTEALMWRMIPYFKARSAKIVSNIQGDCGGTFKDIMCLVARDICGYEVGYNTRLNLDEKNLSVLSSLVWSLPAEAKQAISDITDALSLSDKKEMYKSLIWIAVYNSDFMRPYKEPRRMVSSVVSYSMDLVEELDVSGALSLMRTAEQYEKHNKYVASDCVTLSTIHGAKGKEWDIVMVMPYDNIVFPNFEYVSKMISQNIAEKDVIGYIEQERRLSYVATTRAKNMLYLYVSEGKPSIFMLEALGVAGAVYEKYNNKYVMRMAEIMEVPPPLLNGWRNLINGRPINDTENVESKGGLLEWSN